MNTDGGRSPRGNDTMLVARLAGSGIRLCAGLVLLTLAALPAGAQSFGKNKVQYRTFDWKIVSSTHFDVYYYQGGDSLALRVLDLAEKANIKLTRDMGHILSNKVPIILYLSHNDFAQTNVTTEMLDGSTGGFTELLKNRVVLPFAGSYEELRHVVVHELTHAFMFDMLYSGGLPSFITRQNIVYVPLWFAEAWPSGTRWAGNRTPTCSCARARSRATFRRCLTAATTSSTRRARPR